MTNNETLPTLQNDAPSEAPRERAPEPSDKDAETKRREAFNAEVKQHRLNREWQLTVEAYQDRRHPKKNARPKKSKAASNPAPDPDPIPLPKLHGSSRLTREQRKHCQESDKPSAALAEELGCNVKTVRKHRMRSTVEDYHVGPLWRGPANMTSSEMAFIIHYRVITGLSLDMCHKNLCQTFPKLSRAALWRLFRHQKVNRLPWGRTREALKDCTMSSVGSFLLSAHTTFGEPSRVEGERGLFAAIEARTGRVFIEEKSLTSDGAVKFLHALWERFEGKVHEIVVSSDPEFASSSNPDDASFPKACRSKNISLLIPHISYLYLPKEKSALR